MALAYFCSDFYSSKVSSSNEKRTSIPWCRRTHQLLQPHQQWLTKAYAPPQILLAVKVLLGSSLLTLLTTILFRRLHPCMLEPYQQEKKLPAMLLICVVTISCKQCKTWIFSLAGFMSCSCQVSMEKLCVAILHTKFWSWTPTYKHMVLGSSRLIPSILMDSRVSHISLLVPADPFSWRHQESFQGLMSRSFTSLIWPFQLETTRIEPGAFCTQSRGSATKLWPFLWCVSEALQVACVPNDRLTGRMVVMFEKGLLLMVDADAILLGERWVHQWRNHAATRHPG